MPPCSRTGLQALAAFIGDCQDNALLEDMLQLLLVALHPSHSGCAVAVAGLHAIGGPRVLLSLLSRASQTIRLLGLKLLSAFAAVTRPTNAPAPQGGLSGDGITLSMDGILSLMGSLHHLQSHSSKFRAPHSIRGKCPKAFKCS